MEIIKADKKARKRHFIICILISLSPIISGVLRRNFGIDLTLFHDHPKSSGIFMWLSLIFILSLISYFLFKEAVAIKKTGRHPPTDQVIFDTPLSTGEKAASLALQTSIGAWVMLLLALTSVIALVIWAA